MGGKPPKGKVLRREEPQRKNEPTNPPHTTKIQQRQPEVERPTKLGKPATEPPVQAIFSLKEITLVGSMTDGWCGSPEKDDHGLLCPICRQSDESEFVQGKKSFISLKKIEKALFKFSSDFFFFLF